MRRTALALVMLLPIALTPRADGAAVSTGWIPDSAGLLPLATVQQDRVSFVHVTRRLVPQPGVPGRILLGHALSGLYQSVSGGGWVTLTPGCASPVRPPVVEDLIGALSGCGVEGIAVDPTNPLNLAVSAYNLDLLAPGIPVNPGGVYISNTGGVVWRKALPGIRGNALALRRDAITDPATIVAGRIQRALGDVGTDSNSWCRAVSRSDNCSPSVYVSRDDGRTWTPRYFEPAPCPNAQNNVFTSSRIVGNLAFDPVDDNVIYAGANSGLWVSSDDGTSWRNALAACGTNPGFAATRGAQRRLYVGTFDGKLYAGATGPTGPSTLQALSLSGARIDGQVLSILIDTRDRSERTLFVASWTQPPTGGGGSGGVYKVIDRGDGSASVERLGDSLLDFTRALLPPDMPSPYPLTVDPSWRPSLFLAQSPVAPDLLWVSTVLGGVWVRSDP